MTTYRLRPIEATVTAEQLTPECAAYAVKHANMTAAERKEALEPQLPKGVTYSDQGRFMLDVPGPADDEPVAIDSFVLRDLNGELHVPPVMSAEEFARKYEQPVTMPSGDERASAEAFTLADTESPVAE